MNSDGEAVVGFDGIMSSVIYIYIHIKLSSMFVGAPQTLGLRGASPCWQFQLLAGAQSRDLMRVGQQVDTWLNVGQMFFPANS